MLKDIEEALEKYEKAKSAVSIVGHEHRIKSKSIEWLRHLLSIISQKDEEIEKIRNILKGLDAHIDFGVHLEIGEVGISDVNGINQVFDDARALLTTIQGETNNA